MTRPFARSIAGPRSGVSLLEVLVVLTILGVLAGAVAPAFRSEPPEDELQSATRDVRQLTDRARRAAIDLGVPVNFLVDAIGSRYWVIAAFPKKDTVLSSGLLKFSPGVELVSTAMRASVRFAPTGVIASHDAIVVRSEAGSVAIATASWHGTVPRNDE